MELSKKQKTLASKAGNPNKIEAVDLQAARETKNMGGRIKYNMGGRIKYKGGGGVGCAKRGFGIELKKGKKR